MGGGPRTFPGGVNKWQWKRMLVKRREEREERRLVREKEVYKMRQRADVLAAHPELEQPWEKLASFPPPGTSAQQQLNSLVGRFQKSANAEDLWNQRDGPQQNCSERAAGVDAPNHLNPSRDASASHATHQKDQARVRGARQHVENVAIAHKNKEASPIGKSMQDYLDAFETDPLGVAVTSGVRGNTMERHRDPLGSVTGDNKASTKKRSLTKRR